MPALVIPIIAIGAAYILTRRRVAEAEPGEIEMTDDGVNPADIELDNELGNGVNPADIELDAENIVQDSQTEWGTGWVFPVPDGEDRAIISQEYKPLVHLGVDIMFRSRGIYYANAGVSIVAARDGVVWSSGMSPRGISVVIDHGPPFATFYQHLESSDVVKGQRVFAGEKIGTMGIDPLDAQHVRHLHFAVWYKGSGDSASIDPTTQMANWRHV